MNLQTSTGAFILAVSLLTSAARGDLVLGTISNFQDGTNQGWTGGTINVLADSGPSGLGDYALELSNGGFANNFAMFNAGVAGVIDPSVRAIRSDIFRPANEGSAEIRLVLFDNAGTRWTSTNAVTVVDDGAWRNFSFSILEADLTRVFGSGSYADLNANFNRIMFRYDPGPPNAGGSSLDGTMRFDNIAAIPEPTTPVVLFASLAIGFAIARRRKN